MAGQTAAKEVGLVDETGGIYDAISYAAKEVGQRSLRPARPVRAIRIWHSFYKTGVQMQETLERIQNRSSTSKLCFFRRSPVSGLGS